MDDPSDPDWFTLNDAIARARRALRENEPETEVEE